MVRLSSYLRDASAGKRGENIKLREKNRDLHTKEENLCKNQTLSSFLNIFSIKNEGFEVLKTKKTS